MCKPRGFNIFIFAYMSLLWEELLITWLCLNTLLCDDLTSFWIFTTWGVWWHSNKLILASNLYIGCGAALPLPYFAVWRHDFFKEKYNILKTRLKSQSNFLCEVLPVVSSWPACSSPSCHAPWESRDLCGECAVCAGRRLWCDRRIKYWSFSILKLCSQGGAHV